MSEVQIAIIDEQDTQIALAVPGIQGPAGAISSGGSANQVFYKVSGTNYDAGWTFIGNANVDAAAAIAGTKISPNFGSQATVTTGTNTAASFIPTSATIPSNGIYLPGANQVAVATNGTQRLTFDASGRLLVGTTTTSATCTTLLQSTGGTGGTLILSRNAATPADGEDLGFISFNDSSHIYNNAVIRAQRDGGTWNATTSKPTRLVFSTTADGGSSPTEAMRINSQQELLVGTATRNANGGVLQLKSGITFPATAVAASDANTLDDYEEGTWTATITPQTSGTITLSANTGHYVKIGKQVVVNSKLTVSAVSTPLGHVKISLPFNSGANAQGSFSAIMENTVSTGAANFWSIVPASSNSLEVYLAAANNPSTTSAAQFQAGSTVWLTATYFV